VRPIRPWVLLVATLGLFAVWSNSFIAIAYLLGADAVAPRFDWRGLTVARFLPAAGICAVWCLGPRRSASAEILRRHWRRLVTAGLLAVPGYNLALYYGQQHGVSAPVAALTTALLPLFVMVLAGLFLGERPTARRLLGFGVAVAGMTVVASAKRAGPGGTYPLLVAVTALAPLCWSLFSVISKPMAGRVSPLTWTYLATAIGGLLVVPLLPGATWRQWSRLDAPGWFALLYLSLPCTVLGFALWTWLLRHLPASSVGFAVFLNPPLTTLSKYALATSFPATFRFTVEPREWLGGALALAGLAVAVWPAARRRVG
jgi:drug/metabolite transporter (DMT)-like permease